MLFRLNCLLLATAICAPLATPQSQSRPGAEDAQRQLWAAIRKELASDKGPRYFADALYGAELPPLRGTVISATPPENPDTIILAMSDGSTPEVTLQLIEHEPRRRNDRRPAALHERVNTGDEVEFSGIGSRFTKKPFMLTFDAPVDRLTHNARGN